MDLETPMSRVVKGFLEAFRLSCSSSSSGLAWQEAGSSSTLAAAAVEQQKVLQEKPQRRCTGSAAQWERARRSRVPLADNTFLLCVIGHVLSVQSN